MKSYEVLRLVLKKAGIKQVAAEFKLSPSLLYQWSRAQDGHSAAINPLDRVVQLMALPGGEALLDWLCRQAGGTFVRREQLPAHLGRCWKQMLTEMEALLSAGDGNKQMGDRSWKLGHSPNSQRPSANCHRPGAGESGGARCRYRRADGRCGWRAARRN